MPGVRQFQYDDMRHYVRDCADILGLRDWTCEYYLVPPEDIAGVGVCGAINIKLTRRTFTLWLPPDWYDLASEAAPLEKREDARETIAHELLHVHFEPIHTHLEQIQTNLGESLWNLWHSMYVQRMEVFTDTISHSLAEALPLPAIPESPPENAAPVALFRPEDV